MIDLKSISLGNAEANYTISNTPMFLANKLRQDSAVIQLSTRHSSEDLYASILETVSKKPTSTSERVFPFVLMAALSLKTDYKLLSRLSDLNPDGYRWFGLVQKSLMSVKKPTTTSLIDYSGGGFEHLYSRGASKIATRHCIVDAKK